MTYMKLKLSAQGVHVCAAMFSGPDADHLALAGKYRFREDEYRAFMAMLRATIDSGLLVVTGEAEVATYFASIQTSVPEKGKPACPICRGPLQYVDSWVHYSVFEYMEKRQEGGSYFTEASEEIENVPSDYVAPHARCNKCSMNYVIGPKLLEAACANSTDE